MIWVSVVKGVGGGQAEPSSFALGVCWMLKAVRRRHSGREPHLFRFVLVSMGGCMEGLGSWESICDRPIRIL